MASVTEILRLHLEEVAGRRLSRIVAGEGTGSAVDFCFSARPGELVRITPARIRSFRPSVETPYGLLVKCAWRLDGETGVVCGGWDDNTEGGPMLTGLAQLVGREIETVDLTEPGLDLTMRFAGGLVLRVFCDQVNEADADDNYYLFFPGGSVAVGTKSRARIVME